MLDFGCNIVFVILEDATDEGMVVAFGEVVVLGGEEGWDETKGSGLFVPSNALLAGFGFYFVLDLGFEGLGDGSVAPVAHVSDLLIILEGGSNDLHSVVNRTILLVFI